MKKQKGWTERRSGDDPKVEAESRLVTRSDCRTGARERRRGQEAEQCRGREASAKAARRWTDIESPSTGNYLSSRFNRRPVFRIGPNDGVYWIYIAAPRRIKTQIAPRWIILPSLFTRFHILLVHPAAIFEIIPHSVSSSLLLLSPFDVCSITRPEFLEILRLDTFTNFANFRTLDPFQLANFVTRKLPIFQILQLTSFQPRNFQLPVFRVFNLLFPLVYFITCLAWILGNSWTRSIRLQTLQIFELSILSSWQILWLGSCQSFKFRNWQAFNPQISNFCNCQSFNLPFSLVCLIIRLAWILDI